jgi:hypothetical protein
MQITRHHVGPRMTQQSSTATPFISMRVQSASHRMDEEGATLKERLTNAGEARRSRIKHGHDAGYRIRWRSRRFEAEERAVVIDYEVTEGATDVNCESHRPVAFFSGERTNRDAQRVAICGCSSFIVGAA